MTTAFERDGAQVEALLTDLYLESVLARAGTDLGPGDTRLDPALRAASDRLRRDLVRVHPSFRFEERLATRLAEAAAGLRMRAAAGAESAVVPFPATDYDTDVEPLVMVDADGERLEISRPLLIGGALTSAAISLAGAAYVAWRRTRLGRGSSPMARAARAVREARSAAAHVARLP
jgi:hypothetical protein